MKERSYRVRQEAAARIMDAYSKYLTEIIEVEDEAEGEAGIHILEQKQVVKHKAARLEEEAKEHF
jgi:hypothetical protein